MPIPISITEPVCRIHAGLHVIERPIVLDRPVRFECEPGAWFVSAHGRPLFECRTDGVAFIGPGFRGGDVLASRMDGGGFRRWLFSGCEFDGSQLVIAEPGELAGTGLAADVDLERCLFHGVREQFALLFRAARDCCVIRTEFADCGVSGSSGDAIKCTSGSEHITIRDCSFRDIARDAVDLYWSNRVTVENCHMLRCGGYGIDAKWRSDNPSGLWHRLIRNEVWDCGGGINASICGGLVDGNIVTGCQSDGIRCVSAMDDADVPCEWTRLVSNMLIGNKRHGMYVAGRNNTAGGNTARDNRGKPFVLINVTEFGNTAV